MTWPDVVNGIFELGGGFVILLNIRRLYRDKQVQGVSAWPTVFFTAWGVWNAAYYYPHLDQWMSFLGGMAVVAANAIWIGQVLYYIRKDRDLNPHY